jgi:hypothetical protein
VRGVLAICLTRWFFFPSLFLFLHAGFCSELQQQAFVIFEDILDDRANGGVLVGVAVYSFHFTHVFVRGFLALSSFRSDWARWI